MLSTLQNVNTYLFTRTVRFLWIDKCSTIMMKPHYNETNKQTNKPTKRNLFYSYFMRIPPKMSENTYFGHALKLVEL